MADYVVYLRVSTDEQGRSGLGLEAQRAAIQGFLREGDRLIAPEFLEIESGKRNDRPELAKALDHARLTRSTLLVAKLDRLSRNMAFIAQLMEAGVPMRACDSPDDDVFTMHLKAAFAQEERKRISERTKAALQAAKARGKKLGGFRGVKVDPQMGLAARKAAAGDFKTRVQPVIRSIINEGTISASGIARTLNERGIKTRRGGDWTAQQVQRVLA
jgi:DNA invertase Pin-like site-specific DNA recombinase